ncbi:MAG: hypothetical protein KBB01_03485 [Candidatus Omnitrophica bacterium]|nr:hypothetical protein [Candidatus Omnitrophota bacterium]
MSDLISYFEGEVDFDIDNIRKYLKDSAKLDELISLAKTNSTHPVIEFIQKIFKELARE